MRSDSHRLKGNRGALRRLRSMAHHVRRWVYNWSVAQDHPGSDALIWRPGKRDRLGWLILSKDRALQLDCLLRSLHWAVGPINRCQVLYSATSDRHAIAYEQVLERHAGMIQEARRETHFAKDLSAMAASMDCECLAFLVDDLVFVKQIDIQKVLGVDPRLATFSFRLGRRITACQPMGIDTGNPHFHSLESLPAGWLAWKWAEGAGDWNTRASLDGSVLSRDQIVRAMNLFSYFNGPQTLEWVLNGTGLHGAEFGVCEDVPSAINLAINRVSGENIMFPHGAATADDLLEAWESGMQIALEPLRKLQPNACHIICDLPLEPRAKPHE